MKKLTPIQQNKVKRFWRKMFKYSRYVVGTALGMILIATIISFIMVGEAILREPEVKKPVLIEKKIIATAYSSTERQTDSTPFITAYNTRVRKGIVANNCLKQGDEIEIFGEWYVVDDKKNKRYGCEWFDIWFETEQEAINFGIRETVAYLYIK